MVVSRFAAWAAAMVLTCLAGCAEQTEACEWTSLGLPTTAQLLGIDRDIVVGADATVFASGEAQSLPPGISADLLAVVSVPTTQGQDFVAVGTGGTVLHGWSDSYDGPLDWTVVDVGTNADLRGIGLFETQDNLVDVHLVVVGDGVLVERTPYSGDNFEVLFEWTTPEPPPEGWGSLRSASTDFYTSAVAVGDGGRVLARDYLLPQWSLDDIGTTEDLLAYCNTPTAGRALGRNGSLFVSDIGTWERVDMGTTDDFVACAGTFVLTGSGRVLDVDLESPDGPVVSEVATVDGLRDLRDRENYADGTFCVEAVGDAGIAIEICPCSHAN